jgi:hypothetical protein
LVDVGGQRNERRKWAHFFDSVTAVLFMAALDECALCSSPVLTYGGLTFFSSNSDDMVLEEDSEQNRMTEAIQLLGSISKMGSFINTTFILFLNKVDLFTKKIETAQKPLDKLFPDYTGGADAQAASAYPFLYSLHFIGFYNCFDPP